RQEGSRVINASGTLALHVERHDRIAVHAPERFFGEALKARLAKKGIRISGRVLPLPDDAAGGNEIGELTLLHAGLSPPLHEILATMGQYDRNLDADVIFKALGRRSTQRPGSFQAGTRAVMDFVRANGMRGSGMLVLDGSGLSELNRVSPRQVMSLFKAMRTHPELKAFEASFAEAGNPGVQENRFQFGLWDEAVSAAPVACLSGITRGAVSLAGWAHSLPGYPVHFFFSIVGSTLPGSVLIEQLDALAMEITRSTIRS
ncbi:D-alanyl-D-alanine carboxypeptidase, partial [Candidatus Sumerlaeota bacterium]|nr:D-alanyl-D-alanine carboxypeptidase [Candidatus Sumerlaeota bacterium]